MPLLCGHVPIQSLATLTNTRSRAVTAVTPARMANISMSAVYPLKHDGWRGPILRRTSLCEDLFSRCGSESEGPVANMFVDLFEGMSRTKVIALTAAWMWHTNTSSSFAVVLREHHEVRRAFDTLTTNLRGKSHAFQ